MVSIPEAKDVFFADEPGLVAVFDYDYDLIVEFKQKLAWAYLVCFPPSWISAVCCSPCFLNQNIEWDTRARHVALTVDGIKFVHNRRKSMCGLSCTDRGKESKTVPYDKITDCDVQEPAGTAFCCCIENVLHTVSIDTASSGQGGPPGAFHELKLEGLKHPIEFKRAVWGMKRGEAPEGVVLPVVKPKQMQMDAGTPLLSEIRDELRKLNSLMESKYGSTA
eukprot:TRINITY_DN62987_c0_g1_i1.p1 TRINITY_DN62987_c0_g1~~TRINITY_DN62987_c0_g1_i1.p1  ORF type:complete len:221 (+),score=50.30 TRINITY_DN62987_c0_g1_i1:136-798(+)